MKQEKKKEHDRAQDDGPIDETIASIFDGLGGGDNAPRAGGLLDRLKRAGQAASLAAAEESAVAQAAKRKKRGGCGCMG